MKDEMLSVTNTFHSKGNRPNGSNT